MNIDEELLNSIHDDLDICRDYLHQIANGMIKGEVSKYPIFVALRGVADVDLGLPVVNRNDYDITWNFNASHLEEFVAKNIVAKEKTAEFIKAYKNPKDFMCVFIAEEGAMSFAFMPYDRNRANFN